MDESFQLKIISPQSVLYEGQAFAVSSTNSMGPFDILAEHADFITIIENQTIIVRKPNKEKLTFTNPLSIIYTQNNHCTIYVKTDFPIL